MYVRLGNLSGEVGTTLGREVSRWGMKNLFSQMRSFWGRSLPAAFALNFHSI